MGYRLRREVRNSIPPGLLTAAERLLVLEVADQCNDVTREGWPGADALAELTDLSPRSIQESLNRIGKKWIELRVPLGKDAKGRPYYSHAGKRTTFRFPPMPRRKGTTDPGPSGGATNPGAFGPEGATDPGGRCDESVPKVRQIRAEGATDPGAFSSRNHSEDQPLISLPTPVVDLPPAGDRERDEDSSKNEPQDPRHQLVIRRGALIDEAPQVVALIEAEHSPRSIAWWRTVDRQGDLGDIITKALARIRAAASPEALRPPEVAPQPPHCGSCDPNRFVWVRAASGRVALAPCPTCHRKGKPLPPGASIVEGPDYQSDRPARPARQLPLCGRSVCRDGWYQLGINKVRCHICPDPNEPSTTGLGEKEATTA